MEENENKLGESTLNHKEFKEIDRRQFLTSALYLFGSSVALTKLFTSCSDSKTMQENEIEVVKATFEQRVLAKVAEEKHTDKDPWQTAKKVADSINARSIQEFPYYEIYADGNMRIDPNGNFREFVSVILRVKKSTVKVVRRGTDVRIINTSLRDDTWRYTSETEAPKGK